MLLHTTSKIIMADDDGTFVYLGGDQVVPDEITHAIIDPSVKIVRRRAFYRRRRLVSVIFHDGVEIIEEEAFYNCQSLSGTIKLLGVRDIEDEAFDGCIALTGVEFGDRLETIGFAVFWCCCSLRSIKMPSVRNVRNQAFGQCRKLMDVEFGVNLESIGCNLFQNCPHLRRIAIPLKDNLFSLDPDAPWYDQFEGCDNLRRVDLVGAEGMHKTISSLLLQSWKDEMSEVIGRINRELPSRADYAKTDAIRIWIRIVINRMTHYKTEHNSLLKEHMTQLELAVWKAKLDEKEENSTQRVQAKRAKIEVSSMRKEKRITSGADIIIKNVLPFLRLA